MASALLALATRHAEALRWAGRDGAAGMLGRVMYSIHALREVALI